MSRIRKSQRTLGLLTGHVCAAVCISLALAGCPPSAPVCWTPVVFETAANGETHPSLIIRQGLNLYGDPVVMRYENGAGITLLQAAITRNPDGHILGYSLDAGGDGTVETRALYARDAPGASTTVRIIRSGVAADGPTNVFHYDSEGRLARHETNTDGNPDAESVRKYEYDSDGHLVGASHDEDGDGDVDHATQFVHDDAGAVLQAHHDEDNDGDTDAIVHNAYEDGALVRREHEDLATGERHILQFDWTDDCRPAALSPFHQEEIALPATLRRITFETSDAKAARLDARIEQAGPVTIIHLTGDITIDGGSVALRMAVMDQLNAGPAAIVLDLAGVRMCDSAGIGELVSAYTTCTNRGTRLVLVTLPPKIQDILMITRLITVFDIYDSMDEVLAALS